MNDSFGHTTNAAVAMYLESKKNWRPKKPWIEMRDGLEVHCAEVWCDIDLDLVAQWAGEKEYDSWK